MIRTFAELSERGLPQKMSNLVKVEDRGEIYQQDSGRPIENMDFKAAIESFSALHMIVVVDPLRVATIFTPSTNPKFYGFATQEANPMPSSVLMPHAREACEPIVSGVKGILAAIAKPTVIVKMIAKLAKSPEIFLTINDGSLSRVVGYFRNSRTGRIYMAGSTEPRRSR